MDVCPPHLRPTRPPDSWWWPLLRRLHLLASAQASEDAAKFFTSLSATHTHVAKDVAHAAKAEARPAPMDVVKDVAKDAIAVADAADVVANAAVNALASASVLMPKESPWQRATTPRL